MLPKLNSAHGSETRNIINRAIEMLNRLGVDVQTLVAEGQLTEGQYANLINTVNGMLKSGHVSIYDLSKELRSEIQRINKKTDKSYVDELFTKVGSAKPSGAFPTLADLKSTHPNGDGNNYYVVTADNNWYYYNGSDWQSGGLFNATVSEEFPATNLVDNGDFSDGTAGWYSSRSNLTAINNTLNIEADGTHTTPNIYQVLDYSVPANHKFYLKFRAKTNDPTVNQVRLNLNGVSSNYAYFDNPAIEEWKEYSTIQTLTGGDLVVYFYVNYSDIPSVGASTELQYAIALDLTETFGEGKEPTVEEMDALLENYPNMFFDGTVSPFYNQRQLYQDYKSAKEAYELLQERQEYLENTAGEKIEPSDTTFFEKGSNLYDRYDTSVGSVNPNTGLLAPLNTHYISSNYIEVSGNTLYSFPPNPNIRMAFYDGDKVYISGLSDPTSPITTPANAEYVRYSYEEGHEDTRQFVEGGTLPKYEPYSGWTLGADKLKDDSIPLSKLNGVLNDGTSTDPNEILVDMQPDNIYFYIKGSDNQSNDFLKYSFTYENRSFDGESSNGNLDAWRLRDIFSVTRTGEWTFEDNFSESLTTAGVWEFALKEKGMGNFMGGGHGSEIMSSAFVRFDGIEKPLGTTEKFKCKDINFVQKSTIYRWLTETPVGETVKMYEINAEDGIKLTTEIKWSESILLGEDSYLPMFPIKRLLTDDVTQITDRFYRDTDYEIKDVTTQGSVVSSGAKDLESGVTKAVIWGEDSGFSAEVIVLKRPNIETEKMYVTDSQLYNKFYFMTTGADYTTKIGEEWKSVVIFKMNTIN